MRGPYHFCSYNAKFFELTSIFLSLVIFSENLYNLHSLFLASYPYYIFSSWYNNKLGKWYNFFIPPIIPIPDIVFIRIQMKISKLSMFVGVSHGGLYYKWSIIDAINIAVFKHIRTIHSLRYLYSYVFLQVLGFTLWCFFSTSAVS